MCRSGRRRLPAAAVVGRGGGDVDQHTAARGSALAAAGAGDAGAHRRGGRRIAAVGTDDLRQRHSSDRRRGAGDDRSELEACDPLQDGGRHAGGARRSVTGAGRPQHPAGRHVRKRGGNAASPGVTCTFADHLRKRCRPGGSVQCAAFRDPVLSGGSAEGFSHAVVAGGGHRSADRRLSLKGCLRFCAFF